MTQLHRLAYISKSSILGTKEYVKSEIMSILASAERNNPKTGVTGALLYSGGYFCQIIEGPQDALEELIETIETDDRHDEVTILFFEPIKERGFDEWAMAFAGIEDTMRFDIDGVRDSKDEIKLRDTGRNMTTILERLITENQESL